MSHPTAVVACSVMELELRTVIGDRSIDLYLLEQGLHNTPQVMPGRIQEKITEALSRGPERILLGYGLCSNGIVGLSGGAVPLVAPRCHDCIALLLGSAKRYNDIFHRHPGTYYLSAGWIRESEDPLGCVELKYAKRLGPQKAKRAMDLELKNYTHICYIDNGLGDARKLRARAIENCRAFNKEYVEVKGSLNYFRAMVDSLNHDREKFIAVEPGQHIIAEMFLNN